MKYLTRHPARAAALLGLVLVASCASERTTTAPATSSEAPKAAPEKAMPAQPAAASPSAPQAQPQKEAKEAAAKPAPATAAAASLALPTGDRSTSTVLIERYMPAEATVGIPVEYETVVTNLTSIPLENLIVSETADPNFAIVDSDPQLASSTAAGNSWDLGTLQPHESVTIKVRGAAKATQPVRNCTSVSYTSAVCAGFDVVLPALQLIAAGTAEALVCDELTYTYKVTNTGTGTAKNVVVDVQLPEGIVDSKGQRSFKKSIAALAGGRSEEFSIQAKGTKTGAFSSKAVATAEGDLKAVSEEVKTVLRQPRLQIKGSSVERVFEGRDLSTEFTVTNEGDAVAHEVTIEQAVPAAIKFKSATEAGKFATGTIRWTFMDLKPKESRKVAATFGTSAPAKVKTTATAKTYCADVVSAVLEPEVVGIPAILLEVVDLSDPIVVGTDNTYLITVTNQGTAQATNVKIAVVVPEEATFVSAMGQTPTAAQPGAKDFAFAPVASIGPKQEVSWRVTVRGVKAGDARFKVSMTSNELKSPVEETEATNFYD